MSRFRPKPDAMPWLTPYLMLKDYPTSKAFYEDAFGFENSLEIPGEHGQPMHSEFTYKGETLFMCAPDSLPQVTSKAPATSGSEAPVGLFVYVDDVDAFTEKARGKGAQVVEEPTDQFWGDRTVRIADPSGYHWTFASNFEAFDPSKVPQG